MSRLSVNGVTPPSPMGIDKIPSAQTALGITAETVLAKTPVRLARISVLVAGAAAGVAYDDAAATAGKEVFSIPNAVGVYEIDWPCQSGLTVAPGAGQTIAVAWY